MQCLILWNIHLDYVCDQIGKLANQMNAGFCINENQEVKYEHTETHIGKNEETFEIM